MRHGEVSSDFSGVASGCSFFTATGYAVGAGWFFLLAKNNDGGLEAGVTRGPSSAVYAVEAGVLMLGV